MVARWLSASPVEMSESQKPIVQSKEHFKS